MRTLHADLITAQRAASRTPYVRIQFGNGGGASHLYKTNEEVNRIVSVNRWAEPYAGVALIRLRNHDQHFKTLDLRGYEAKIGWGYICAGSVPRYSFTAPYKVLVQRDTSYEGELVTEFYCVSPWAVAETTKVFPGGTKITGTIVSGDNFKLGETITGSVSGATGKLAVVGEGFIVVTRVTGTFQTAEDADGATASCDSVTAVDASTYGPLIYEKGDIAISAAIASLLAGIVDGVTVDSDDPDGAMASTPFIAEEVGTGVRSIVRRLIQKTKCGMRHENDNKMHILYLNTAAAAEYSYNTDHAFWVDVRERAIIIPNSVIFVDQLPATDGTAATYVGTANDATSVAAIGEIKTIQVDPNIPFAANPAAEATRLAEAWIAQRVAEAYQGRIVVPMNCAQELYDMVEVSDTRADVTVKGRVGRLDHRYEPATETYELEIRLGGIMVTPGSMDVGPDSIAWDIQDLSIDTQRDQRRVTLRPLVIPKAVQGYQHNLHFVADDQDTVSWEEGTIKFYDGSTQNISSGSHNLTSALVHYIYFDLDDANPNVLKVTDDYLDVMTVKTGVVCLIQRGSNAEIKATVIPSYGKEPLITADVIHMAGLLNYNYGDNKYLQVLLETQVSAGLLKLTTATVKDDEWYNESGVEIDARHGINIYGKSQAFTTRATKDGPIQCYVGSNGKIYAGAGAVVLDATGLDIKGQTLTFRHTNGVLAGRMHGVGDALTIVAETGKNLNLWAGAGAYIRVNSLNPIGAASLGVTGTRWSYGFINRVYANTRAVAPVGTNLYD